MNNLLKFFFQSEKTPSSGPGELTSFDWKKTLRMIAIIALGGAITAIADYVSKNLAGWDFGAYAPFITPIISGLLELARRWATTTK